MKVSNRTARPTCLLPLLPALAFGQEAGDVIAQGEKVFKATCATGYCHGAKGVASGAPRLAARGFDQAFINATVTRGISGTAMPAFGTTLDRRDLTAVVAYVASLNGIAGPSANTPSASALSPEASRGRELFFDATRGFGRCSTCHEVGGVEISVATPITTVPASAQALRNLATPDVHTAVIDGESMPALVVSQGQRRASFTISLRRLRYCGVRDPAAIRITEGSSWKHSSLMGSYGDAELAAIPDVPASGNPLAGMLNAGENAYATTDM